MKLLTLPVGGFIVLAVLIAAMQWALDRSKKKAEEAAKTEKEAAKA